MSSQLHQIGAKRPAKYRARLAFNGAGTSGQVDTFTAYGSTYAIAAGRAMRLLVEETGLVHHAEGSPHNIYLTIDWNPARAELWVVSFLGRGAAAAFKTKKACKHGTVLAELCGLCFENQDRACAAGHHQWAPAADLLSFKTETYCVNCDATKSLSVTA